MATFSHQHNPFLLDSNFLQNPTTNPMNISCFIEDGSMHNNCLPQIYPSQPFYDTNFDVMVVEVSQLDQSSKIGCNDDEPSKQGAGSSIVVDKIGSGKQETQKLTSMEEKRKNIRRSSLSSAQSKDAKKGINKKQKKTNDGEKEELKKGKYEKKDKKKVTQEPPSGYIHVRARRGQATDSHSLAERVRRKKISEKMKILQGLVPGCDQVTGKALILDEIINYVQSLQNQVEFLSMKLASVNPLFYEFGVDLDASIIMPERLSGFESALPSMQNCSPTIPTPLMDTITITTTATTVPTTNFGRENAYPIMDSSTSLLLEEQRLADFTKDTTSLLWDLGEQRQEYLNPYWFSNNMGSLQ